MYDRLRSKSVGKKLKQHHHIYLNKEFTSDCQMWLTFLTDMTNQCLYRPFADLLSSDQDHLSVLNFYSDDSKNATLGIGAVFNDRHWLQYHWPEHFVQDCDPSIKFLELYALTAALVTWATEPSLNNNRVVIFCDNQA